ncbi:MAG: formate dehydrogenase accessory sulfurtransferase FdhD [Defluviitaleaceae bacterium]|nr:formate dehydrogenase accessory sulfurtransferase FdhD [Defluviitaleaceae bacterium]
MIDYVPIIRYDSRGIHEITDPVVRETRANLIINGTPYLSVMVLPQFLEEWAVGFMYSEGLIKVFDDIRSIKATADGDVFVATHQPIAANKSEKRVLVSGCAHGTVNLAFLNQTGLPTLDNPQTWTYLEITEIMERFNKQSPIFNEAGGVHSAALCSGDGQGIFFEDIGRHNAVDKVVGAALMKNLPLTKAALLTSGRISTEIALKTIRAGIPTIISRSGPTSMSLAIAEKSGITLIGFARGRRFNIYCGENRIGKGGGGRD